MNLTNQLHSIKYLEFTLSDILNELWVYKWVILISIISCLSLGVFYSMRMPAQFQSSILLQVDSKNPGVGLMSNSLQAMFSESISNNTAITQISLIQSRFILGPVIKQLGLDISAKPKLSLFESIYFKHKFKKSIELAELVLPRYLINKKLSLIVENQKKFSIFDDNKHFLISGKVGEIVFSKKKNIKLKVNSLLANPGSQFEFVKNSEEKVIRSLLKQLSIEEFGNRTRQNTGILEVMLKGTNPDVLVAILNKIADIAQLKDSEKKAREAAQTLNFLYKQLPFTKKSLEKSESALNHYRAKSGKIDIKLQAQSLLTQLADISKRESELRIHQIQMSQKYTNIHPVSIAIKSQFKALKNEKNKITNELKKLPESDQVAVNLMRDVKVRQSLYTSLLKKIQELEVVKAGTVSSVRILSRAKYPDAPLPGKKIIILLTSVLFGLMFSFILIFARKLLFPKISDPHWCERQFNLPNLAVIPFCVEQSQYLKSSKLPLISHLYPRNLAIESLRSLRTSLQVDLTCASNNIIVILGICPGVGKSFISANLAYLLAAGGKRVLLIDADLRKGSLHKYFDMEPASGLSEVLRGEIALEDAIKPSIINANLSLLPRGQYPEDPSELLMSQRFKALLDSCSNKYDIVMFDTPPVLLVTDAVLVSRYAAINYLVLSSDIHMPSDIKLVLQRLSTSGVKMNGSIFNFQRKTIRNTAYYGKYYKYSYYEDESIKP